MRIKLKKIRKLKGLLILLLILTIILKLSNSSTFNFRWFQEQEFAFYDSAQIRALDKSTISDEIVIIGITEEDIQKLETETLDDLTLTNLIQNIQIQEPIAIGLDIIRDLPVGKGQQELEEVYKSTDNLYGVGKFTGVKDDAYFQKVNPPPTLLERGKVGDVSIIVDDDGVVRRGNLFPTTGEKGIPSLGLILAHRYLIEQGYKETTPASKDLQLGNIVFPIFNSSDGGYVKADDSGYQILMNWNNPSLSFIHVSLTDVLSENIDRSLFTNKIVLVGYYTTSTKKDMFYSPFSNQTKAKTPRKMFGVEVHANLISYLIHTVNEEQILLKSTPDAIENLFLLFWVFIAGISIWQLRVIESPLILIITGLTIASVLIWLCWQINYQIFVLGWWLPIFPTIAIGTTSISSLFYIFRERNLNYVKSLEKKVEERTLELESYIDSLKKQQSILIEKEKLAFLGRLTAGFCHQFKNPLYALKFSLDSTTKILTNIDINSDTAEEEMELIRELILDLNEPINKLELLFKLILISPTRKNISWLEVNPNIFVSSILTSCFRFKFVNIDTPKVKINKKLDLSLNQEILVPQQLEIPIFNIIDNAFDALSYRSLDDNWEPELTIETIKQDNHWQIIISDNGDGIPKKIENSLFEPFVTTKPETHGIGLGLWISNDITTRIIGGKISVSRTKEITSFSITIPLKTIIKKK